MADILGTLRQFRGSRPANVLASVVFLVSGIYGVAAYSETGSRVLGGVLLLVGLLGVYNQFRGESLVETLTSDSK